MQSKANTPQNTAAKTPDAQSANLSAVNGEAAEGTETEASASLTTLGAVLEAVEELWPQSLAEDWDAVIGHRSHYRAGEEDCDGGGSDLGGRQRRDHPRG